MREKVQQKSSSKKPCPQTAVGIVQDAEAVNCHGASADDSAPVSSQRKTAGGGTGFAESAASGRSVPGYAAGLLIFIINLYRKIVSPWLPPSCRFYPTCSQYAVDALKYHGFFKGVLLTAWRLLRCQPFCRGGIDPVPPVKSTINKGSHSESK
jgi:putative membrane protein insertion efficiency factor